MTNATSLVERGFTAHQAGELQQAEALYLEALQHEPSNFNALQLLGVLCIHRRDYVSAEVWLVKALKNSPDSLGALLNYALVLQELLRSVEAIACYDRILALHPGSAEAHNGRGMVLNFLNREDEAFTALNAAVEADPYFIEARLNRGLLLDRRHKLLDARLDYQRVLQLDPMHHEAMYQLGISYLNAGDQLAGLEWLDKLLAVDPSHRKAEHHRTLAAWHFCDWTDFEHRRHALIEDAGKGGDALFQFNSVTDDPYLQLSLAQSEIRELGYDRITPNVVSGSAGSKRRRIAYISADFREHAVSYLAAGLFELHDRERFEIIGVYHGPMTDDALQQRIFSAFDRLYKIHDLSDEQAAAMLRHEGIDIAVDLTGATDGSRLALFAHRIAPIQVNYLGYPGTLWRSSYDYILADRVAIPVSAEPAYAEAVALMPNVFQINDHRRTMNLDVAQRSRHRLPEEGFVFCAFHNGYKMNPPIFAVWMRLLAATPGSVLLLRAAKEKMRGHLCAEAEAHGIDRKRLIFGDVLPYPEHLARLSLADLALDTFPFTGATTTSDMLFAGVPMVTLAGRSLASRMSASLLHAVDMDELICNSIEEYEATAQELVRVPGKLLVLRSHLASIRETSALFDSARFTADLEQIYEVMLERQRLGQPATTLEIVGESGKSTGDAHLRSPSLWARIFSGANKNGVKKGPNSPR